MFLFLYVFIFSHDVPFYKCFLRYAGTECEPKRCAIEFPVWNAVDVSFYSSFSVAQPEAVRRSLNNALNATKPESQRYPLSIAKWESVRCSFGRAI